MINSSCIFSFAEIFIYSLVRQKTSFKQIRAYLLVVLLPFLLSSCSDQGCIEADDFGEYETQTVTVVANASAESCTFDSSKPDVADPSHGSGIKPCLTSGTHSITDETGATQLSTPAGSGCEGFTDVKFRNLCISNCVQQCQAAASSGSTASAEPNWTSTDKKISGRNVGITIRPGAQVIIRTVGSVVLGEAITYPDIYVQANNPMAHSKNSSWSDVFFDARANQSLMVKFSGRWQDGADTPESASTYVGGGSTAFSSQGNTASDAEIYNGARRIVAFLIAHPSEYDFDSSKTSEEQGSKDVPLLPDPRLWQCSYSGITQTQSSCSNSYYHAIYPNVNDALADAAFPIKSNVRSTILTKYGGVIRWDGDGLQDNNFDPFIATAAVSCDASTGCTNIGDIPATQGRIMGDISGGIEIQSPNTSDSYKVSFKSLTSDNACNITISSIRVANTGSITNLAYYNLTNVAISNSSWTSGHIALEPNQKLVIATNTASSSGINCGRLIGVRFTKYHDLTMEQSGFVKLTILRGSGNCTIKGRIVNPGGSHSDSEDPNYTADFYEYDSFAATSPVDPLANLNVSASTSSALNWSSSFFVRKGQKIRFSPESWNGTWTTDDASTRKCGIGMAMMIDPSPAVLCRGRASSLIYNPACSLDYNSSGTLIGCKALNESCNDSGSSSFCPGTCQATITCTAGTESNNFQKTACGPSSYSTPSDCTYPSDGSAPNNSTCSSCFSLMKTAAGLAARLSVNDIDQCYDASNYNGKIANIPPISGTSTTTENVDGFLNTPTKAKGLTKLSTFSGSYGNFAEFADSGSTDGANSNKIYQLKIPLTFTTPGRLKFIMLDGMSFKETGAANNNTIAGGSYSGSNGFRVQISGTLEFSNGQWLQARICKETSDTGTVCKGANPTTFTGANHGGSIGDFSNKVPTLTSITAPSSSDPIGTPPNWSGNYKFDAYGNITRFTSPGVSGDCTLASHGVATLAGSLFYCHTYLYFTPADLKAKSTSEQDTINSEISKLRITFKILDPEIGNCNLLGINDGIKMKNPFYDPATSSNTGATCSPSEIPGDTGCKKEFYCANRYANNSGKYYVNVKVKVPSGGAVSSIVGSVINPIVEVIDGNETTLGQAERVYRLLIADARYKAILNICLVTMFTFYGFGYLLGVSELNHAEIINRIIKIGLIYLFVGEQGWEWFNKIVVRFFKDGTNYLAFMMASSFDNSPELTNAINNNAFQDKSILFTSVDKVFSLFFSSAVQKKISALLFASIFGWAYLLIIYSSFLGYVYAVANAVLLYLTAQVFISILFVLGPIFFIFTLFAQTKEMFDNWLKQLIGFSLQQIFLLTTLAFFNMLMYEVIKMSLGYKICWDEVWTMNLYVTRITLLSFWTIASLPPRTNAQSEVGNIGNPEGIPSLFTILFIWVIASLMKKFIEFMTNLAATISGGLKASSLGSGVADFASKAKNFAASKAKAAWDKSGMQAVRRLDMALFDSGKMAEEARLSRKKQNAADLKNKGAMTREGERAVSAYKKSNASELAGMGREEQRAKLASVRDAAMSKEGKKLGLDDDKIKSLKSDKGLKYEDTNVFGAGLQALKQAATKGGSLRTAIEDRKVSTKFSHSEGQQALKKMSKEEREKFVAAAQEGKVKVGQSSLDYARENKAKTAARVVAGLATLGLSEGMIRGGKAIGKAAKENRQENRDYDEATKELEAEGLVTRMATGANWTRSDAEKKMIRARAKNNAAQKKVELKTGDKSAVAELERESQRLGEVEGIGPDEGLMKKTGQKLEAWRKRNLSPSLGTEARSTALQSIRNKAAERVASELAATEEEMKDVNEGRKSASKEFEEADKDLKGSDQYKEMESLETMATELGKQINASGRAARQEKKKELAEVRKKLTAVKSDPKLAELNSRKQKAATAANKLEARHRGLREKRDNLQKFDSKMSGAKAIVQRAREAARNSRESLRSATHEGVVEAHRDKTDAPKTIREKFSRWRENRRNQSKGGETMQEQVADSIEKEYSDLKSAKDFERFEAKHHEYAMPEHSEPVTPPASTPPAAPSTRTT
ncbi:MAG: hypothetical protein A2887_02600 [Alphaproteobacteria bacterium RIFCSPLOWO2_01_FULL_40_26]|nr:MAG: hypothetical protein A3D15_03370 [Alphaproteobacteria bacterium RIFCSPHIGHO2_02_FULL_40_34]OFW88668.1 MAG: hypothetical protein A2794_00970 [Alphaproteobacteria bacterium RIFCSPHIGHO2_01_FULL_40_8]OFW94874.1 MAG: hypothetical protein A2887_02600 [Alphaproteobacteria bacterium RIFCSPLOWO2_01_FULL_40_26]OFX10500.1 MAG: hypothetical protein A3H30_04010 [Alphaproteobacteria bacterium RIFCSPLOWO2_02_FULL_40_19]